MRHKKHSQKLSRPTGHRVALLRNLAQALVNNPDGRIETTVAKAKALQPFVESLVTLGKKGQLHHWRLCFSRVGDKNTTHRIFQQLAPTFAERNGGYTRVIRTRRREGDGAEMAFIEFVDEVPPIWVKGEEAQAEAANA